MKRSPFWGRKGFVGGRMIDRPKIKLGTALVGVMFIVDISIAWA